MGGKSAGTSFEATVYGLSIWYGWCYGPIDSVEDVEIAEKSLGISGIETNTLVTVNKPDLFGGLTKGGGVEGFLWFLRGGPAQSLAAELANKLGRTPDAVGSGRGVFSTWFTGGGARGFLWGANIPSVPAVRIKVRRSPKGLEGDPWIGADANPAHVIYECLTNTSWGSGYEPAQIDLPSFLAAAQTLRNESFGLSLVWDGKSSVEDFTDGVLAHIAAVRTFDMASNQWSLKLLREEVDLDSLRQITPRNAEMKKFQRRSYGESTNQIVVTWTNPKTEQTETVTQQDASGFEVQKTAISDSSRDFIGIRKQSLAWKVAERELRAAGAQLASVEVDVDLSFRGTKPGDLFWFNWDEPDEDGEPFHKPFVVRVVRVKQPVRAGASLTLNLVEDVFSLGESFTEAQEDLFLPSGSNPVDPSVVSFSDSPYFAAALALGDAGAAAIQYPQGHVTCLVQAPSADTSDIQLYSLKPLPESGSAYALVSLLDAADRMLVTPALGLSVYSTIPNDSANFRTELRVGSLVIFGQGNTQEICVISALTDTEVTLRRGCLDTVVRSWPAGSTAWVVARGNNSFDSSEVMDTEPSTYKLSPITTKGSLALSAASERPFTVGDRMHRPLRPANVQVDAVSGFSFSVGVTATSLSVSWSSRNRFSETSQTFDWSAAPTSPEAGQTTSVALKRGATVLASAANVASGSVALDLTGVSRTVGETLTLEVWSSRDGFDSWQRGSFGVVVV